MCLAKITRVLTIALLVSTCCNGPTVCDAQQTKWPMVSVAKYEPAPLRASSLLHAESVFAAAIQKEAIGCQRCVDLYFQAASSAWLLSQNQLISNGQLHGRALDIYRYSLKKLISTGQQFNRLCPRSRLQVFVDGGQQFIPVVHQGFVQEAADFDYLILMDSTNTKELEKIYRCNGLGVSTVVQHCSAGDEPFRKDKQSFAATAILRPMGPDGQFVLELLNPLRVKTIDEFGQKIAIVRDVSAPFAYVLENKKTNPFTAFLHPGGTTSESKLFMLEPYQRGKIPLVFVHGLLSDPFIWANMANEMVARPELLERYQIWAFEYATGAPFLTSAADLRDQLVQARATFDPTGNDQALSKMVLIGHSMGGLISKLQVTQSGDQLWQSVSRHPLNNIATSEATRTRLARAFYFDPSNSVARVIYMGTPHRGSPWAQRPVGRIGAKLVEEPPSLEAQHKDLISRNPGNFSLEFKKRIPSSIDLLRPDSQLLLAMDRLCVASHVQEHSVIGTYRWMLGAGNSDGVVPITSAIRLGTQSELLVRSKHTEIPGKQDAVAELVRILWQHVGRFSSRSANPQPTPY